MDSTARITVWAVDGDENSAGAACSARVGGRRSAGTRQAFEDASIRSRRWSSPVWRVQQPARLPGLRRPPSSSHLPALRGPSHRWRETANAAIRWGTSTTTARRQQDQPDHRLSQYHGTAIDLRQPGRDARESVHARFDAIQGRCRRQGNSGRRWIDPEHPADLDANARAKAVSGGS